MYDLKSTLFKSHAASRQHAAYEAMNFMTLARLVMLKCVTNQDCIIDWYAQNLIPARAQQQAPAL
jgi:hypothetical protein